LSPKLQVNVDVYRLNAYQLGFEDLVSAIRAENLSIPGARSTTAKPTTPSRIPGEFKKVTPLEDVVVKIQNGKPIYVRDVASVELLLRGPQDLRPPEQ